MAKQYSKSYLYLRLFINVTATFTLLILSTFIVSGMILGTLGLARNWVIQNYGRFLGRTVLRIAGIHMNIVQIGESFDGPAVYISNHSSTIDLFIILGLGLPRVRFVAKYELQYNPFFFIMGRITDQIFIKRQDSEKAVTILRRAYEKIHRHKLSLYVAPEGTRKHPGTIGPFKKGAFRMAIDLGYPIVPMYFSGTRELCPVDSLLVRPGEVTVYIHPPIDTSHWRLETLDEHIEDVRNMYLKWAGEYEQATAQAI
ncbi:MAG: lysophospholipid acyltransferase family protein [candidate division KSB1 bacterium]|nr:lysophospholipid acyltransferase family protein [candidate division KSB1 bacterium]